MKEIICIVLASFAAASLCASAAELSDQERAELRQRAQEFQNQRARDPDFQPGEGRATAQPADEIDHKARRTKKTHAGAKHRKETAAEKAKRKVRSMKNLPGAFVHGR